MKKKIGWVSALVLIAAVLGGMPLAVGVLLVGLFVLFNARHSDQQAATSPRPVAADTGADTGTDTDDPNSGAPSSVQFSYLDAKGDLTQRMVDVTTMEAFTFTGYCHKRRALRTFRYDRVVGEILDMDTGELLAPEAWRCSMVG